MNFMIVIFFDFSTCMYINPATALTRSWDAEEARVTEYRTEDKYSIFFSAKSQRKISLLTGRFREISKSRMSKMSLNKGQELWLILNRASCRWLSQKKIKNRVKNTKVPPARKVLKVGLENLSLILMFFYTQTFTVRLRKISKSSINIFLNTN